MKVNDSCETDKLVEVLLRAMAHEVRTPLGEEGRDQVAVRDSDEGAETNGAATPVGAG